MWQPVLMESKHNDILVHLLTCTICGTGEILTERILLPGHPSTVIWNFQHRISHPLLTIGDSFSQMHHMTCEGPYKDDCPHLSLMSTSRPSTLLRPVHSKNFQMTNKLASFIFILWLREGTPPFFPPLILFLGSLLLPFEIYIFPVFFFVFAFRLCKIWLLLSSLADNFVF